MAYLTKTKFSKFTLMISKFGANLVSRSPGGPLRWTPFFDFNENWSDKKIYNKLGLTNEEIDLLEFEINSFFSNYPNSEFVV